MASFRKSHTVRSAEDDLMSLPTPKSQDPGEARCVPLATGAMALSVCRGEQHKAEACEYPFGVDDPDGGTRKKGSVQKSTEEETSGDD